jgi:hypothetical protein
MPKSKFTGTQKKAQKRDIKFTQKLQDLYLKDVTRQRPFTREARRDLQDIQKGKGLPKYQHMSLKDIMHDFERAGKGAEKIFEPIKQEALKGFEQYTQPQLVGEFGQGTAGSSAMNQALAAARGNLARQLAADFSSIQSNLANNFLGQREQQRQFQQGSQLANLQSRLQSSAQLLGQPFTPQYSGLGAQSPYQTKSGQTSGMGGQLIGGGLSALGSYASSEAGAAALSSLFSGGSSAAAAAAPALIAASSRDIKENIKDYDEGIGLIRDLNVKKYDYTVNTGGRQKDCIGLIAEEVPEVIRTVVGDDEFGYIKAVDVYGLVALLVNAVKQLDIKVKELEARYV